MCTIHLEFRERKSISLDLKAIRSMGNPRLSLMQKYELENKTVCKTEQSRVAEQNLFSLSSPTEERGGAKVHKD